MFTKLLVYATHVKLCHTGVNNTVTALHQSYWISTIRQCVRKIALEEICCWHQSDWQALQDTRSSTILINQPNTFKVTGIDFKGAFFVRDNGIESKVYICLSPVRPHMQCTLRWSYTLNLRVLCWPWKFINHR